MIYQCSFAAVLAEKTDFKKVSNKDTSSVLLALNERPRKKLNYQTPAKLMTEYMVGLAASIVMHFGVESATYFCDTSYPDKKMHTNLG